jgi:SAM-dependent methyltransferase
LDVTGKKVLEAGAFDVNGSARPLVEALQPRSYIGIDIRKGPCVDVVCNVSHLTERFGSDEFDIVITTEMLEHVENWRAAMTNLKDVLKPGGVLLLTTRRIGFHFHGYPNDYWRYEPADLNAIFADFAEVRIETLPHHGIAMQATKPLSNWEPEPLDDIELYRVQRGRD